MGCGQSTRAEREESTHDPELTLVIPQTVVGNNTSTADPEDPFPAINNRSEPQLFVPVMSTSSKEMAASRARKEDDLSSISSSHRTEDVVKPGSSARMAGSSSASSNLLTGSLSKIPQVSRAENLAEWLDHIATPEPGAALPDPGDRNEEDCDPVEELYHMNSASASMSESLNLLAARAHEQKSARLDDVSDDETPAQEERMKDMDEVVSSETSENEWMYQLQHLEKEYRRQQNETAPPSSKPDGGS